MNDRPYRNPSRPSNPNALRGPGERPERRPPEYDEAFDAPPPRRTRDLSGPPDRRPSRDFAGAGAPPRPPRSRDESGPDFERRPPRSSRDLGMPPRGPRYPDDERLERPGRGMGRPEGREGWSGPRPGPDGVPGMRPRRPRPPGSQPGRRKRRASPRLHWRYRYGALLGIMLFAAAGGISLGFSDIGGHNVSIGLIVLAVPTLLVSIGCAVVYVRF